MSKLIHSKQLTTCLARHSLFHCEDDVQETSNKVGEIFRPHHLDVVRRDQKLNAEMNCIQIGSTSISRLRYRAEVAIASDPLDTFFLVMMPLNGSAQINHDGQQVQSHQNLATVINPNSALKMQWQSDCHQLIFRIDRALMENACATHLGHELHKPLRFELGMNLQDEQTSSFQSVVAFLASADPFVQSSAVFPVVVAQAEQLLIGALLSVQQHNYRAELLRPKPSLAPGYIKRCEEYLAAHTDQPITMSDLAKHSGVSSRSLQMGFQRYRDVSPMVFLKNLRLDRVREELLQAKTHAMPVTVTSIALRWGFSHLGHFTRAYAERFRELPSSTLKS